MTRYRNLDIRGFWQGDIKAQDRFANAFAFDCGSDIDVFCRVYGWEESSVRKAIDIAFPYQGDVTTELMET